MKTSLETLDSIKQRLTVEVDGQDVTASRRKVLDEMRKEIQAPGFRKGKVPDDIIIQRHGDEVISETIKQVVRDTYPAAVREAGAKPLGDPRIEPEGKPQPDRPFTYKATFEVYPEVTATGYEKLSLEREKVVVTDEEVEGELGRLQQRMTQLEPMPEGKIGPGTVAVIDFKGTAGGEPFAGSEAENYVVDFGSGRLLEEFEIQIEGMKAGEKRDIQFIYPQDYFKGEVAGKEGKFQITAKEVRRKVVPKIDDEFARELGKYSSIAEVRADLKKKIGEFKEMVERNRLKEQAIRSLIEKHKELQVPFAVIDAELGNMLEQLKQQMAARGQTLDESKFDAREFVQANVKEATDRARGYMVVEAVARQEKIEVSDEELEARVGAMAAQSKRPVPDVRRELQEKGLYERLRGQMRFDKTLDFILDKAKIKMKKAKKKGKEPKIAKKG